jgi:starch-binding outer membrane protein, SusD/RagB family
MKALKFIERFQMSQIIYKIYIPMKRYKIFLLVAVFSFLSGSCSEDYLDVENKNAITQNDYYNTAEHAQQAVITCYDAIKSNGLYGLRLPHMSIAIGDFGVYENDQFQRLIFTADHEHVKFIWGYLYRGITKCNLALEKIPQIDDPVLDDYTRNRLTGEVKFLKSLYNFILHTRFNTPPLLNERILDMQATFGNSEWSEYLEQIEKDLLGYTNEDDQYVPGAIELLPESYDDENIGRATKGAALTLMGQTYMYHEDFTKAKQYLQDVVDMGVYELSMPQGTDSIDYVYAFLCNSSSVDLKHGENVYQAELNKESVFSVTFAYTDFVRTPYLPGWMCDGHILAAYNGMNGWGNTSASATMANEFEKLESHPGSLNYDPRKYGTVYTSGDSVTKDKASDYYRLFNPDRDLLPSINTGYAIKKGLYPLHEEMGGFNAPHDFRLLRYSHVLLMLAEAEYHLNGSTPLALDAINQVRSRAGLELLTEVTPLAIIHERACEFGLEGIRFWNLVRWGRLGGDWPQPTDYIEDFIIGKHEFLPVPTIELSKMQGELKQNPGW